MNFKKLTKPIKIYLFLPIMGSFCISTFVYGTEKNTFNSDLVLSENKSYPQLNKVPTEWTQKEIQEFLDQTKSGIEIESFKGLWNPTGCNNDNFYQFELNDTYILRIAINNQANIPREKDLIKKLNATSSVTLPNYTYVSEDGSVGIYKKIQGNALTKEKYNSLSEDEKHKIAESFASFFYNVHNLYTIQEAEEKLGILDETAQVLKGVHKRFRISN